MLLKLADFVAFRSFTLYTEARSLNDLVAAGNLKAVTAQLDCDGMLVVCLALKAHNQFTITIIMTPVYSFLCQ